MTAAEIRAIEIDKVENKTFPNLKPAEEETDRHVRYSTALFLREIAAQLADMNEQAKTENEKGSTHYRK